MPSPSRSLADELRSRSPAELSALLVARPDLADPLPVDLASLAARAATRASVHRALSQLDAPTLTVARVATLLDPPVGISDLAKACASTPARVRPLLQRLRGLALIFGGGRSLQPVRALAELLGPYPAGLGPSVTELFAGTPGRLAAVCAVHDLAPDATALAHHLQDQALALLRAGPAAAADVLRRIEQGAPGGRAAPLGRLEQADRALDPVSQAPVEWLLARGLLVASAPDQVVIPREVGIGLRGHIEALPAPPPIETGEDVVPQRDPDRVAPGAATELVRLAGELLRELSTEGVGILRNGGVSVRDLTRLTRVLGSSSAVTALLLICCAGAGLIGLADDPQHGGGPQLRSTPQAREWSEQSLGSRWVGLVEGWLAAPWSAALVGERDERGAPLAALSQATQRPIERRLRGQLLAALAAAGGDASSVRAWLEYLAPRGAVLMAGDLIPVVLGEAHHLGLLAFDRLAGYARPLIEGEVAVAAAALDAVLPAPVTQVLIQADLTAVAPGPLVAASQELLEQTAQIESRGAATVYRFSAESLGRALDGGLSAAELLERLRTVSATPLPQPLEYLIGDVARRHGVTRVGIASSYLRCDDEATLAELLASPSCRRVGVRLLAPTVAVSAVEPRRLLQAIREAGAIAVQEQPDGSVLSTDGRRPVRATAFGLWPELPAPPPPERAEEIVEMLLHVEGLQRPGRSAADPGQPPQAITGLPVSQALARLAAAAHERQPVWVSVSDASGRPRTIKVHPLRVGEGWTQVVDVDTGRTITIPAHRIAGVSAP